MALYTKKGDGGKTSLYGGRRVSKSHFAVEAYGSVDELSSFIGLVRVKAEEAKVKSILTNTQKNLYLVMSVLSGSEDNLEKLEDEVEKLEKYIDQNQKKLPKLKQFILPQGSEISSLLHICRAVTRRAERLVVRHFEREQKEKPTVSDQRLRILKYLNRLSDLFFVMARAFNKEKEAIV